jgi:hypothetical protein
MPEDNETKLQRFEDALKLIEGIRSFDEKFQTVLCINIARASLAGCHMGVNDSGGIVYKSMPEGYFAEEDAEEKRVFGESPT